MLKNLGAQVALANTYHLYLEPGDDVVVAAGGFMIESPCEIEIAEGDVFYSLTSPGSIIAIVQSVEFDSRDPFKKCFFRIQSILMKYKLFL